MLSLLAFVNTLIIPSHMGKSINKRLRELGAVPFHSPAFADEATNMEETVEPWIKSLFPAIKALLAPVAVEAPEGLLASGGGIESPRVAEAATGRVISKVPPMVGMSFGRGCVCCCSSVAEEKEKEKVDGDPEKGVIKLAAAAAAATATAGAAVEPEITSTNLVAEAVLSEPTTVDDDIVQPNGGDNLEGVWSPRADSGARSLSCFLSAEHLEPDFACPRHELPSLRATAPDVQFSDVKGVCVDGESVRRRSTSTESRHTCDRPFGGRVLEARYLTEGGREAERRWVVNFFMTKMGFSRGFSAVHEFLRRFKIIRSKFLFVAK